MAARGVGMAAAPEAAHEPVWSTWGYGATFTKADVLDALPILKRLGIRWIQFDDPWYSDHGDMTVNAGIFPGGAKELADFIGELKEKGFRVRLWACSGHATSNSPYARTHPERMIRSADGAIREIHSAGLMSGAAEYEMCPCVPENRRFAAVIVERMFREYGAEAIYQDGIYGCPECHDGSHGHSSPLETGPAHAEMFREIYGKVMELSGGKAVVMLCQCGKAPDFHILPFFNRVATADPMPVHVRKRVKSFKALLGGGAVVDYDFVENSLNDFAGCIGTGAAIYVKFSTPMDERLLAHYEKWLAIAREHDLVRGEYLNLYDIVHDYPEAHAVRRNGRIYYAFYASRWAGDFETPFTGSVRLRGLSDGTAYRVHDYVNGRDMGVVVGPEGAMRVDFCGSLLIYAEPCGTGGG